MASRMKLVVVGAVAGGASAAARARRLNETAKILLLERGSTPSFANCGMPYHISGEIPKRESLLVTPATRFGAWYNIDLRSNTSAEKIDRTNKTITCKDTKTGETFVEPYDKLILSTGAAPMIPPPLAPTVTPLLGRRLFTLRTLEDMDAINQTIAATNPKHFVVLGGGYVGIELADALAHRGFQVTVIERADQILMPFDKEMTVPILNHLRSKGVNVMVNTACDGITAKSADGTGPLSFAISGPGANGAASLEADSGILCVGVRPENDLAVGCGLEIGARRGIKTNKHMQTSDPDIYAVGDSVETTDFVTGESSHIPLAGPANRQGRVAASHAMGRTGEDAVYRGTQGTSILRVFDMAIGSTGANEKTLQRVGIPYMKAYVHGNSHASYFPGATRLHMKVLFSPKDGKILGGQVLGAANGGVDTRVDVLATALQGGLTVYDLEEMELAYAPQFGSAKDPINMIGFVAAGMLRGDQVQLHLDDPKLASSESVIVDVRMPNEFADGHLAGAVNIPLPELRSRVGEVKELAQKSGAKDIITMCKVGFRGYMGQQILRHNGVENAKNLGGGFDIVSMFSDKK